MGALGAGTCDEPFVSVGPVHFGMDYEAASAAIGGLAPAFTPGQERYVQLGTLIVVEFGEDGRVEGVSMAPDPKHGGVVAALDGLLLQGKFTRLDAKLMERGFRILPNMPPYPAGREPMMHLPDQGINIGRGGTPRVADVWAGRREDFTPEAIAKRAAEREARHAAMGLRT